MSADPNTNGGLGCGGALLILLALGVMLGLTGLGSDTSRWDCPGEPTPCSTSRK